MAVRTALRALAGGVLVAGLAAANVYQYLERSAAATWSGIRRDFADNSRRVHNAAERLNESIDRLGELERSVADFSNQRVIDRFHQLFYDRLATGYGHWLGVETRQNPNDVWVTQELLWQLRPELVVETGTANGGSALIWAMLLEHIDPDARVITIDIENHSDRARALPLAKRRIEFLLGSSTAPKIVERVRRAAEGKNALVILDSDHSKAHVLAELRAYAPLIRQGGYLIVQDTNINGHPVLAGFGPGPMEAVDEFLAADDRFQPDRSREKFLFSMHPRGYLKRVR